VFFLVNFRFDWWILCSDKLFNEIGLRPQIPFGSSHTNFCDLMIFFYDFKFNSRMQFSNNITCKIVFGGNCYEDLDESTSRFSFKFDLVQIDRQHAYDYTVINCVSKKIDT
jgi:hypothetical protein